MGLRVKEASWFGTLRREPAVLDDRNCQGSYGCVVVAEGWPVSLAPWSPSSSLIGFLDMAVEVGIPAKVRLTMDHAGYPKAGH